ncbi:hypothetical protein KUTeg_019854 [Tegillarca granosa]|uniref:Uncharacterized protein n=1 Tax=Tegillarca granosa TaxID=220873 RepID=A0ABQ9EDT9_TEGGR|nr:hypothetical protein KUTeg_019854 [Tegillarca granosa]
MLFQGENIVVQLPVLVCLLFLILKFGHTFLMELYRYIIGKINLTKYGTLDGKPKSDKQIAETKHEGLAQEYQLRYVRSLFKKPDDIISCDDKSKFEHLISGPHVQYRHVTCDILTFGLFQWGFVLLLRFSSALRYGYEVLDQSEKNTTLYVQARLFIEVTTVTGAVAFALSTLIISYHTFNILRNYRGHLQRLYKGDFSKLPTKMLNISASETMTYSLHYAGIQIAVLLLGYTVLILVVYIVGLILAYFLVLPFMGLVSSSFLQPFYALV